MELSKKDAIINHRKLWNWIADETLRRGQKVSKKEYFFNTPGKEIPFNYCYCCQYISNKYGTDNIPSACSECPLFWKKKDSETKCFCTCSPYYKWYKETDPTKCADWARIIANLPVKNIN